MNSYTAVLTQLDSDYVSGDFIANVGAFNTNASPVPALGSLALLALGYSRKKKTA